MEDFPYISPCGRERNYIRCDDTPIVYTHVIHNSSGRPDLLSYCGGADLLTVQLEPEKICMLPWSGRVYHPASGKAGGIGLIKSSLAIEFSKMFRYETGEESIDPPTHFTWKDKEYKLTNELLEQLINHKYNENSG